MAQLAMAFPEMGHGVLGVIALGGAGLVLFTLWILALTAMRVGREHRRPVQHKTSGPTRVRHAPAHHPHVAAAKPTRATAAKRNAGRPEKALERLDF